MQSERTIMNEIEHRRLKWYGHLQRMKDGRIPKAVHTWKQNRKTDSYVGLLNVQQAMRKFGVADEDTEGRERWRKIPETGKIFFNFFTYPNVWPKPTHISR